MKALSFYKPFVRENRAICSFAVFFGVINSIVSLLIPLSLGRFYELMFDGESNKGQMLNLIGLKLGESFTGFLYFFIGLIVLKAIFEFCFYYYQELIGEKFIAKLRLQVFHNHLQTDLHIHQKRPTGKYLNRYVSDFGNIRQGLTVGLITFIADVVFFLLAFLLLLRLNLVLSLVIIIGFSFNIIILSLIENYRKSQLLQKQSQKSSYVNFIYERLNSFIAIKVLGREEIEKKRFEKKMASFNQANLQYFGIKSLEKAFVPFGVYFIVMLVLIGVFYLSKMTTVGLPPSYFVSFILLIFALRPLLRRFLKVDIYWKNAEISVRRIEESAHQTSQSNELIFHAGYISFNQVCFGYDSKNLILKNLSFDARRGSITKIVGQSGSGKTTVFRLLFKMYQPQKGNIYIDGQNIRTTNSLTKFISFVSDEIPLLGKDVYEVVSESKNELNRRKTLNILNKITAIFGLTNKIYLERKVQNNGSNLSLLEKKVLNLARAFINDKPIILLDEPFAGLNESMTEELGCFINEMKKNKTILLISSTNCRNIPCDVVVDIDSSTVKKSPIFVLG